MRVRPNLSLFTQTDVDSAALTVHVAVGHAFGAPGRYTGSVLRGKETVGSFLVDVDPECRDLQANIDLAGVGSAAYRVSPQGVVLFHVGSGAGGLAALVGPIDDQVRREVFDSRKLGKGDIIAVTLLRPGTYRATFGRGGASLRVAFPDPKRGIRPMDPVVFEASEDGLQPDGAELQPTQGQLYRLGSAGRLRIELVEPDDGPGSTDPGGDDSGGGKHRPDRPGDRPGGKRPPKEPIARLIRRP